MLTPARPVDDSCLSRRGRAKWHDRHTTPSEPISSRPGGDSIGLCKLTLSSQNPPEDGHVIERTHEAPSSGGETIRNYFSCLQKGFCTRVFVFLCQRAIDDTRMFVFLWGAHADGPEKTPTANGARRRHRGNTSANSFTERVKLHSTFPFFFASYYANNAIEIEKHFNH